MFVGFFWTSISHTRIHSNSAKLQTSMNESNTKWMNTSEELQKLKKKIFISKTKAARSAKRAIKKNIYIYSTSCEGSWMEFDYQIEESMIDAPHCLGKNQGKEGTYSILACPWTPMYINKSLCQKRHRYENCEEVKKYLWLQGGRILWSNMYDFPT